MKLAVGLGTSVLLAIGVWVHAAVAQNDRASRNKTAVTVAGKNYCVMCAIAEQGAATGCATRGHVYALSVADIRDEAGELVRRVTGKTLHYANNANGVELTSNKDLAGQSLSIRGTLYTNERVIEVDEVTLIEGGTVPAGGMSGQISPVVPAPAPQ